MTDADDTTAADNPDQTPLELNLNSFTLNEQIMFDKHSGGVKWPDMVRAWAKTVQAGEEYVPSAEVTRALVWIIRRREDPALTLEEAGDLTTAELTAAIAAGTTGANAPSP